MLTCFELLQTWTQATTYLQLIGILVGQLLFGFMGDWIGRKATMLVDISVILVGVILLTVANGPTINVSPAGHQHHRQRWWQYMQAALSTSSVLQAKMHQFLLANGRV